MSMGKTYFAPFHFVRSNRSMADQTASVPGHAEVKSTKVLAQPDADTFTSGLRFCSTQALKSNSTFQALGIKPSLATEKDLPEASALMLSFMSEGQQYSIDNLFLTLQKRSDADLQRFFQKFVPSGVSMSVVMPMLKGILHDKEKFNALIRQAGSMKSSAQEIAQIMKQRYLDNPEGALIVLRDNSGQMIGMEAVNQFQDTHEFQMDMGIPDNLDSKHGLVSGLYVKPEYRGKGVATALKKAIITYGREAFGYRYIWSNTEAESSSHRINQKIGYRPLTEDTRFLDSPVFTPEKNRQLMDEYNVGSQKLSWLDTEEKKVQAWLSSTD